MGESRADAAITEDDYDGEFRFSGRPLEPLHALDADSRPMSAPKRTPHMALQPLYPFPRLSLIADKRGS